MKIYVTGAAGFTGWHFAKTAQANGHEILASHADLLDREALRLEIEQFQPDYVLHLAAISFVAHEDASQIYQVNVIGTENLLKALLGAGLEPKKVLIASSANVYGATQTSPIGESAPVAPVNHYAISKLASEYLVKTYEDRLPIIVTRPFNYTGPRQSDKFLIPKIVKHFKERAPIIELGNVDVQREFNDVRLVCEAYLSLLEGGATSEVVNICSGRAYSVREVFDRLEEMTGHHMEIAFNPAYARGNEIAKLCGDPSYLKSLIGELPRYQIEDTLRSMLEA